MCVVTLSVDCTQSHIMTIVFPQDSVTKYAKAAKYFVDIFPSRTKYKIAHDWSKSLLHCLKLFL